MDNTRDTFYQLRLAYEVPYDILNDEKEEVANARRILYERINSRMGNSLVVFNSSLVMHRLSDTYNYILTYDSLFLDSVNLPMSSYVEAKELCEGLKEEFTEFFEALGIKYKILNVKALL